MPTLEIQLSHRENGLTATRLAMAALVVLGHTYELGGAGMDPLKRAVGITLGEFGVNAFFAISGFLVTASWQRDPNFGRYLLKRSLRIFPGLWICLVLLGVVFLPWLAHTLQNAAWPAVILNSEFTGYVWKNALLKVSQARISGLFPDNPSPEVVNGSLWSLFPEFLCYLGVAFAGLFGLLQLRSRVVFGLLIAALIVGQALAPLLWPELINGGGGRFWWIWRVSTQAAFFAGGAWLHLHAASISVRTTWTVGTFLLLTLVVLLGAYAWLGPVLLPYLMLTAPGLLPAWLKKERPDYSYGLYIYHYPMLQTLIAFGVTLHNTATLFVGTFLLTLPLAIFSWHCVEYPALRWKPKRSSCASS